MKQAVKTIVTILVAIVCCFASLIAFGFYLAEVDSIEYDAERLVSPDIDVVNVTPLGNDYEGTIKEGFAYYLIEMSVDNKSNYGLESYDVSLYYEAEQDDYYYYVSRVDDQYTFTRWDNGYYIPPGKVGTAFQVICVEDACKEITIIYKNYKTDEEKRIPVNL